ncbi:hypothetical protein BJY04DRAFT_189368 [Aspergillus karnatakaensis]|uniref:uncharacterized protein n=1 Tax=Aspergillus karnatakaensis TaxID=1810916 RepID=UPI003CCCFDD4
MPQLPELSNNEPSAKSLIKQKSQSDDLFSNPESRLSDGMHYDKNRAPDLQDREKGRSEKVDVQGGGSSVVGSIRRGNPSGVA